MPTIIGSLTSLVSSIIQTIVAVFQTLINTVLGTFQAVFAALWGAISGLAQTFEGLAKFLLSNILVIGGLAIAFVLYTAYQQRSPAAKQKKTH
ncbi:hypothetical protein F5884DRAFT_862014 [Xylogone sp. PMI_703]|nr:hypothetical protein F5884DRAFT_862014 [Xylogone sp. PMI_703]